MVGPLALDQLIGVRLPASQPKRRSHAASDVRPWGAPASDSAGCGLDRSPGPFAARSLPRREAPRSLRSGDSSRRDEAQRLDMC